MDRRQIFNAIWQLTNQSKVESDPSFLDLNPPLPRAAIPYLSEAWYCCAEPNEDQLAHV